MIYWPKIIGFDWDENNARKIADKHDVSQFEAEQVFFNQPLLVLFDSKHSQQESRYHALGGCPRIAIVARAKLAELDISII